MRLPPDSRPVVIKLGGGVLDEDLSTFWTEVRELSTIRPVVIVHGGGKQSTELAARLGHTPTMIQGRRVTTDTDLNVVRWVIRGQLNTDLVASAQASGIRAVGISGVDGRTVLVSKRPPWRIEGKEVDFGHVGDVTSVDATLTNGLLSDGFVPIVATMGVDESGAVYNVNGDTVARELAVALGAGELILATDSGGVCDAKGNPIPHLSADEAQAGVASGWIQGGMKVKTDVGFGALDRGIALVRITGTDAVASPTSGTTLVPESQADADHRPENDDVAGLHAMLVAIPSLSREEKPAADALQAWFEGQGLDVIRLEDNIIVSIGSGDNVLLLNSHLDVVPPSADHPFPPFEPTVRDGKVFGRGAVDAKASVAAMACALRDLAASGWSHDGGRVMGAFTVCEELGGEFNGLEEVLPRLPRPSAALVGEPTMMQPCVAQKGLLILKMTSTGKTAHAARPSEGSNAISMAARDIARLEAVEFERIHPYLGPVTANVTMIEGGTARNVIPDTCTTWIDIRSTPSYTHPELTRLLREALESRIDVHSDRFVPVGTEQDAAIVRACTASADLEAERVRKAIGPNIDPPDPQPFGSPTMSDWIYLKGIPAVKIGPGDSRLSHTANEHVDATQLERGRRMYADIIRIYFEG